MKTQHVTWACVLGATTVAGVLLGSLVTGRSTVPPTPATVFDADDSLDEWADFTIRGDGESAVRVAEMESTPLLDDAPAPPAVLPPTEDAQPINETPDVVSPDAAPEAFVRRMIESRLPNASPEEREVWFDELKGLAPEMLEEVLEIRSTLGSIIPRTPIQFDILPERTEVTDAPATPLADDPFAPPKDVRSLGATRLPAESVELVRTSLAAIRSAQRVLLNNVANANTTGFRRRRPVLATLPYLEMTAVDEGDETPRYTAQLGNGVALAGTLVDTTPGDLVLAPRPLDVAINGRGWFQVTLGERTAYTRDGSFTLDSEGRLITFTGRTLEPEISIPFDSIELTISPSGKVSVVRPGSAERTDVGSFETARFVNPDGLRPLGDNLYEATDASGPPIFGTPGTDGHGGLRQGFLESSNVELERETRELERLSRQATLLERLLSGAEPEPRVVPPVLAEPPLPEPKLSFAPPVAVPPLAPRTGPELIPISSEVPAP